MLWNLIYINLYATEEWANCKAIFVENAIELSQFHKIN